MRYPLFLLLLCATFTCIAAKNDQQVVSNIYKNEKEIIFKANDGQETNAFEGFIMVFENRNNTKSRKIRINYVRFPATGATTGSPIIYLAGGPGGSGIGTAKWRRFPLFLALREHADVIALDQRGTGASEKMPACQSDFSISVTEKTAASEVTKKYRQAAIACAADWTKQGADVLGYTTEQNAWDLNDLRQHFNAAKISLWGISYGSHLALSAISLFEQHIDKVIIASVEGLDQTVKLPVNTALYFGRVQQEIQQHPELAESYENIALRMQQVHQQLEDNPIKLVLNNKDGTQLPFLFQKQHMQFLASMMIADPNQYLGILLSTYRDIENNHYQAVTEILERGMFNDENVSFQLMPMAMDVASGITESRLKKVRKQTANGLLGDLLNFPMPHLNNAIEGLDLGDVFRKPEPSSVPVLLFTGTLDGRTYVEGQEQAVAHLNRVTQIKVVNAGHNLFMSSPDVLNTMQQFLRGEVVEDNQISIEAAFVEQLKQSL
ncbi:MAG: pimeloyl-ACP methyl ester carboxylesterase [Candidatus Azotimanducaceae bacterium]|jgi:pimeloyl-ACP methyl ester carboxylesterase